MSERPDLRLVEPASRSLEEDAAHLPAERRGRKSLLTEDTHDAIVGALGSGSTIRTACLYANVSLQTYYTWCQRGRKYEEHLEDGGDAIEDEVPYHRFWAEAGQARAASSIRMTGTLALGATEAPWGVRANIAMWFLERSDPENWGRVNRLELSGAGGGPLAVQVTAVEERLAGEVRALREQAEAAAAAEEEIEEAEVVVDPAPEVREVRLDL